ncbi:hypothetical protein [Streptomyces fungicidicus]|uniref:Uncharacterized protein n=1 Tax=Streptomyces fungicidicus TaxID=68203 RepID=A0ACC7Y6U7_9ACTN|nr:hypothetical protein [Streptomyces fungicidicus]NUV77694.1 hypothetical protein [Streptomyces fungicidicus]
MATPQFSAACPPASHPRASEGYGKRYPDRQPPTTEPDFTGLPPREAAIACYIDRLPEGAAIGYKTLASVLPAYGQQACSSALRNLSAAGHLRRIREHLTLHDRTMRWVTRTYWSREPHDDTWWTEFARRIKGIDVTGARGEGLARADWGARETPGAPDTPPSAVPETSAAPETPETREAPAETPARPVWLAHPDEAHPQPRTERPRERPAPEYAASTPGYRALARLARTDPRLTLSAAECDALAPLADRWIERRVRPGHLTLALTSGLPQGPIHSPAAFLRSRLEKKMPPLPADSAPASDEETAAQPGQVTRVIMICATCDQDETTVPLTDGLCPDCHALIADDPADIPATFRAQPPRTGGPEVALGELAAQLLSR